jgi:hypothetical protein
VTVCCAEIFDGAVYKPELLIDPVLLGLIDHVTTGFVVFATVAVNCCVWLAYRVDVVGLIATDTGGNKVIVAVDDLVASDWLAAMIVTVCWAVTVAGAV